MVPDPGSRRGRVSAQVVADQTSTVTSDGGSVAELHPDHRPPLGADVLVERWRRLPAVDPAGLRVGIDDVLDQNL